MKQSTGASIISVPQKALIQPVTSLDFGTVKPIVTLYFLFFFHSTLLFAIRIMDMHTRAVEGFKRSVFHTRYSHSKPGVYDSSGQGSRERQGRPFGPPEDRAPPIRTESIASSSSFDSSHSDR